MPKTILFVILDQYADWEAAFASSFIQFLGGGKYIVKTLSLQNSKITSMGGFTSLPDYSLETMPEDFEALVLIGGMSWREKNALKLKPIVKQALEKEKLVAGICDASAFLGVIGVLNEVQHTSNDLDALKAWAASAYKGEKYYLKEQAVRDKNIITANGTAALEFAKEICLALDAAPPEKIEGWYQFYKQGACKVSMPDI